MRRRGAFRLVTCAVCTVALCAPLAPTAAGATTPTATAQTATAQTAGPCDKDWVEPTPTEIAVTSVPITVPSTVDDYFVLYVKHDRGNDVVLDVPVLVKRGEAGTTVLSDNLRPLSADKYRVHKYQVDDPADVDGDCIDDITEVDNFGYRNPVNRAESVELQYGAVAIADREAFEKFSYKGENVDRDKYLKDLEYIKFNVLNIGTDRPRLWFQDTVAQRRHWNWLEVGLPHFWRGPGWGRGVLIFHPNVVASDGSLGVYRWEFQFYDNYDFREISLVNEALASAMPFISDNLAYYPSIHWRPLRKYESQKSKYDASRVNVLLSEDIRPDVPYVPYNAAEGYGLLTVLEPGERPGPRDVVILESLPNDLPRVAGSITTVPQTPLSHVNLRAIQNGVPNAFVRDALDDTAVTDLVGGHVYFKASAEGYTLRAASKAEVDAFHAQSRPANLQVPQRDLSVRAITALSGISFDDWDAFGVKAANMAELSQLSGLASGVVPDGFGVPFWFYDEFMNQATLAKDTVLGKKSAPDADKIELAAGTTLAAAVTAMLAHPRFGADYAIQEEMLSDLRKAIKRAQTPAWVVSALETMHGSFPAGTSLRYRSSTNNEDLPDFSGAGLYDSKTQTADETRDEGIGKSIKAVWASLWNFRAFLEREHHRVDHRAAAMGVLVHPNYSGELANGVAVSVDPVSGLADHFYVNTQLGEDLVTNPEVNSLPEELLLDANGAATVLARSNLAEAGKLFMTDAQMVQLRNSLQAIHDRFETLYSPTGRFAMEIEFKITAAGKLAIKQARPWVFGHAEPEVSITAGADITEGSDATFTVAASPPPAAPLSVEVSVSQSGDFGVTTGTQTVTVPTGGSVELSVPTAGDSTEEADGSVDVTVDSGSGYTVSSTGGAASVVVSDDDSAGCVPQLPDDAVTVVEVTGWRDAFPGDTPRVRRWNQVLEALGTDTASGETAITVGEAQANVAVWGARWDRVTRTLQALDACDDDPPPPPPPPPVPVVSVTGGNGVAEGSAATFTVTASPSPTAALTVDVSVAAAGDFGVTTGTRQVTVPATGSATLSVATTGDSADEADGSVTVSVSDGTGYTVSSTDGSATVTVADDDPAVCVPQLPTDAVTVTEVTGWRDAFPGDTARVERWNQVLEALGTDTASGETAITVAEAQANEAVFGARWDRVTRTLQAHEACDDDPPPATPEISISAGNDVTEGGDATFTVSASPSPAAALSVSVNVAQWGDFGVTTGSRTVSIPTAGSATLTVSTSGDSVDEANGSVTATVVSGNGYTVSSTNGTATVAVSDDDGPPPSVPVVSVTAGPGVVEGSAATFTVTASPPPSAALSVSVNVAQSGDFGVTTGSRTVSIPTAGSATLTVSTSGDSVDEANGSVTATVGSGNGYTVSSTNGTATVAVSDDDDPPPPPPPVPVVSVVAGNGVTEGSAATFTVTASPRPSGPLSVDVSVAAQGSFGVTTGTRTVTVPISGSVTLSVSTTGDSTDEPNGSVTVSVTDGSGYTVSQTNGTATVAVSDDDDPPPPPPPPPVPVVSVVAGNGVTEGSAASFTVTASPRPSGPLSVDVSVAAQGSFGVTTGTRTVTVPISGSVTLSVSTTGDSTDEPHGSVTVTVSSGNGYTVSQTDGSASVTVSDDDDPPPPPPPPSVTISIGDASGEEGLWVTFKVTLSEAADHEVQVSWASDHAYDLDDYAMDYEFWYMSGTLKFAPGQTEKQADVYLNDDSYAEADEVFRVRLSSPEGATVADGEGIMTITDND